MVKDNLIYCGGNDGLWSSSNSGVISWIQIKAGEQFGKLLLSGASIFAGISSKGVYLSADNGYVWTSMNQGLGSVSTRKITKGNGSEILAATYEGYLYSSSDEGANWTVGTIQIETGPLPGPREQLACIIQLTMVMPGMKHRGYGISIPTEAIRL